MNPLDPHAEPGGIDAAPGQVFATAMVTGHRPQNLTATEMAWSQTALHMAAWRLRSRYGMREGISGMALGADTWWALAVLATGARLAAYIPCEGQPRRWAESERAMWTELRERAYRQVLVDPSPEFSTASLFARNTAMLNDTAATGGLVVALFKAGTKNGGTAHLVSDARKRQVPLLVLDPSARSVAREGW